MVGKAGVLRWPSSFPCCFTPLHFHANLGFPSCFCKINVSYWTVQISRAVFSCWKHAGEEIGESKSMYPPSLLFFSKVWRVWDLKAHPWWHLFLISGNLSICRSWCGTGPVVGPSPSARCRVTAAPAVVAQRFGGSYSWQCPSSIRKPCKKKKSIF